MTGFTFLGALTVCVCGGLLVLLLLAVALASIHIGIREPSRLPHYVIRGRGRTYHDPRFTAERAAVIRAGVLPDLAGDRHRVIQVVPDPDGRLMGQSL